MIKMMGLLNVHDIVRLIVLALGSYLIYASYKKCDKDNKRVKVIIRLLAVVALATILKAFYNGNFAICGLDYFSNAAIVVILHILVLAATSQLGANCVKVDKKKCNSCSDCDSSCVSNSDWSSSSSSSLSTDSHSSSSSLSSCKKCDKKSKSSSESSSTTCSSSW
jgi:hypothetical protein